MTATNIIMYIARMAPREDDFDVHEHTPSIEDIRAIVTIKPSQRHGWLDMSSEVIST